MDTNDKTTPSLQASLNLMDATMIVAGSMIGSGIFIVSADMVRNVGSPGWLLLIWIITGIMTIAAAVTYGELSAMFPKAGGQYTYLREAYNPLVAFLYGWSFFAVIQTGTIAAVGVAFSKFTAYLFPSVSEDIIWFHIGSLSISPAQILAIAMIGFLTYFNTKGIRNGKIMQTIFTSAKLIGIFGLIICGLFALKSNVWQTNWSEGWHLHKLLENGSKQDYTLMPALGAIAAAMVGSIFSSVAWENVTFIAGEIKNPKRNVGLSLFLGTLIVTIVYIAANVMYVAVLPMQGIADAPKDRVAVAAAQAIFGNMGTYIMAIIIMIATFGCNNGLVLAGARVYYTMAQDGLFFKKTATLNQHSVPAFGLWIQFIMASLLCLSGKYGDLLDMVSFVVVIFYALTIFGVFILRKKRPDLPRPYKAFGYPIVPILYIIMAIAFCVLLIIYKPDYVKYGLGIVAIGIPIYYLALRNKSK